MSCMHGTCIDEFLFEQTNTEMAIGVVVTKLIGWPWVQQRCRWRMGRMNVTPSKFCMEIADLYLQVDEAVKRAVLS